MDFNLINKIIATPGLIHEVDEGELESIVEKFPYFSTAHILLAKKYKESKSSKYDRQMEKAAAMTNDRSLLMQFLDMPLAAEPQEQKKHAEEVQVEKKADAEVKPEKTPMVTEEKRQEEPPEAKPIEDKKPIEAKAVVEQKKEEKKEEKGSEKPVDKPKDMTVFEQRIAEIEAKKDRSKKEEPKSVKEEKTEPAPRRVKKKKPQPKKTEKVAEVKEKPVTKKKPVKKVAKPKVQKEKSKEVVKAPSERTFTGWLKNLDIDGENNDELTFEPQIEPIKADSKVDIESFAEEQVKRKGNRKTTVSADVESRAKMSVEADDDLISDTLARILILQEKYDRAIEMYEKLSLKYPEKSSYFADQILKIQQRN